MQCVTNVCIRMLAEMYYSPLLLSYTWACTDVIYSDILGTGGRKSGNVIKE